MTKKCPVTWNQIAQAAFEPFTDGDWEGFAGCNGDEPQIAVIGDCVVVIDGAEETTYIQVHEDLSNQTFHEAHTWSWEISTKPEQLF